MGRSILETVRQYPNVRISAALVSTHSPLLGQDAGGLEYDTGLEKALAVSDVLVDFSTPASTSLALDACQVARKPIVIGVTGLDAGLKNKIARTSESIAVLAAPNMSLGATLLLQLVHTAASVLGEEFTVTITDEHHRHKKDAPSGTALALGESVASARGVSLNEHAVFELPGPEIVSRRGSIHFASIREGETAGNHEVAFANDAESLELTHHARTRAAFAHGAVTAACWIVGKQAGNYAMADVLSLQTR
jgi:4-hydroxy-tetrahydrodipicolinate reductase